MSSHTINRGNPFNDDREPKSRYQVVFYQCGVDAIAPETYDTRSAANKAAVEFLRSFDSALKHGHRYQGSVWRDGSAAIRDYSGATEALAAVHAKSDQ